MSLQRDFKPFQYEILSFHPGETISSPLWNDRSTGVKKYKFNVND